MNCEHEMVFFVYAEGWKSWGKQICKHCLRTEYELQLQAEVESLKNCANCRHIIWGDGELLCSKNWVGNKMDKCDHWQKAGD